jgi:hypothetical protein
VSELSCKQCSIVTVLLSLRVDTYFGGCYCAYLYLTLICNVLTLVCKHSEKHNLLLIYS